MHGTDVLQMLLFFVAYYAVLTLIKTYYTNGRKGQKFIYVSEIHRHKLVDLFRLPTK